MKPTISKNIIIASIAGCGLCCLVFLLPIATGVAGISVFSFSTGAIICGAFFLALAVLLLLIYFNKKKKKVCELPSTN